MSKICLFADVHWSKNTSIVRSRGQKYSTRLELLIKSMNWVNELAVKQGCDAMICLGDYFDRSSAEDEEISALREIKWNKLPTMYLVGNHESSVSSLNFSTVDIFRNNRVKIINEPSIMPNNNCVFLYLPYVTEDNREDITKLTEGLDRSKLVIISHNDIKGARYGAFESKTGYDVKEIEDNCALFLNGHIHNPGWITNKILNVGSLTAHNFTNDSYAYRYGAWILDTNTLEMTFFENPHSLNFYKIEINEEKDLSKLNDLKNNAVVSIKCREDLADEVRKHLGNNIIESKLMLYSIATTTAEVTKDINVSDHLVKFKDFILSREDIQDMIDIFKEELLEVCK